MAELANAAISVLPVLVDTDGQEERMVLLLSPATTFLMTPAQVRHAAQALMFAADLAEAGVAQPYRTGSFRVIGPMGNA